MIKLLDRYILKQFGFTLLFSILALSLLFVIVNLLERLDNFLDQDATILAIAEYYLYYLPAIIQILLPVATLISTLFTIGRLSTSNEITAMKSGGFSLYRLMMPLVFFTILLSFAHLWFNGWVVPIANKNKIEIESKYFNQSPITGTAINNLFFRDSPTRNVIIQYYNSKEKTAGVVSIEEYSSELKPRLLKKIEAETMQWNDSSKKWILNNAIVRYYFKYLVKTEVIKDLKVEINLNANQIEKLKREVIEMTLPQLKEYIDLLQQGGKDVRVLRIYYYGEYAFPFANFIVILFGVPFASVRRKGGIAIQIAAAMIISFAYMLFSKISQTIGLSLDFNPILAGWVSNFIFLLVGIFTIFKTKT